VVRVGDVEVRRIEEIMLLEPSNIFAQWRKEMAGEHAWLEPNYYDAQADAFVTSIHSWLLKMPGCKILIDSASGNGKERPASPRFAHLDTPYLQRLEAAGAAPADIDLVICTHLHVDHVGWNTRLVDGRWQPTFRNATYVISRAEIEARDPKRGAAAKPSATHLPFLDSVLPILEAGKARIVEGNERLTDEIDLIPVPGHSPGQMAVRLRSRGEEALFIADVMHQPIQVYHPSWNSRYCEDPELAARTRRWVLEYCAEHGNLMLPVHFGAPHCGRVTRHGERFAFVPSATMP